eukprot:gene31855-36538_t
MNAPAFEARSSKTPSRSPSAPKRPSRTASGNERVLADRRTARRGQEYLRFRNLRAVAHTIHFVNLDEIARGLSPLEPQAAERDAARVAIARCRDFMRSNTSFAMETTLAGRTHFHLVDEARAAGMHVNLQYFSVPYAEICLDRIARRVAEGGHDVPEAVVRRRFGRSLAHVRDMAARCDLWRIFDASVLPPRL